VTATTFQKVIERDLSKKVNSPALSFAGDILGAKEYTEGTASSVKGVVVKGDKISITLVKPAADFLSRIAMPFFCAVPDNTPLNANGVVAPPAAGPYYIKSRTPSRQIVLARNPNYGGDRKTSSRHHDLHRRRAGHGLAARREERQDRLDRGRVAADVAPGAGP
jgi:ABC-type oligopeptide transport system substrate-binding subunit